MRKKIKEHTQTIQFISGRKITLYNVVKIDQDEEYLILTTRKINLGKECLKEYWIPKTQIEVIERDNPNQRS